LYEAIITIQAQLGKDPMNETHYPLQKKSHTYTKANLDGENTNWYINCAILEGEPKFCTQFSFAYSLFWVTLLGSIPNKT